MKCDRPGCNRACLFLVAVSLHLVCTISWTNIVAIISIEGNPGIQITDSMLPAVFKVSRVNIVGL